MAKVLFDPSIQGFRKGLGNFIYTMRNGETVVRGAQQKGSDVQ